MGFQSLVLSFSGESCLILIRPFPGSFVFWHGPEGYPDIIPDTSHECRSIDESIHIGLGQVNRTIVTLHFLQYPLYGIPFYSTCDFYRSSEIGNICRFLQSE